LVVEGDGGAIRIAQALAAEFPGGHLQTYAKFQTAEWVWQSTAFDFAMARREHYAYPGANPTVAPCSLYEDLYRRDFTVNALAWNLHTQTLLDRFDGQTDLAARQLRAIRPGSFAEDPRRIYRGARLATRLGFALAPSTAQEVQATCRSETFAGMGGPRLRFELDALLQPQYRPAIAAQTLYLLAEWAALRLIHPTLQLPPRLDRRLACLDRHQSWLRQPWPHLPLLLVLTGMAVPPTHLGLSRAELEIWQQVPLVAQTLPLTAPPSTTVQAIEAFREPALLLAAVGGSPALQRQLQRYAQNWRHRRSPLTGSELQALGYRGPAVGQLLQQLRGAVLDDRMANTPTAAIAFLQAHSQK
jgi:tRNA nucleotidyltransferase (CCA-adding enzyme)